MKEVSIEQAKRDVEMYDAGIDQW
jgi:hypothetical protein